MHPFLVTLWEWKKTVIFFVTPLLVLPLPLAVRTQPAYVAYTMAIMAVYWVSETLPIGVTALIPMVLMPAFGVVSSRELAPSYFEDSNMLFIGGLMLAISVEFWNLHKRVALLVLRFVGIQPRWLLLGFMAPTWFMSMWISNTATSAMMLPIVDAVLQELMIHDKRRKATASGATAAADAAISETSLELQRVTAASDTGSNQELDKEQEDSKMTALEYMQMPENRQFANVCKMLTISVAYSANIGGTGTLTGTAPNLVLNNNIISSFRPGHGFGFLTWMQFALPASVLCIVAAWLWLQLLWLGPRNFVKCRGDSSPEEAEAVKKTLTEEYKKLGPITFPEVSCIIAFSITILLWISRSPGFDSWGSLFVSPTRRVLVSANCSTVTCTEEDTTFVGDAQPALIMSILLFALPSRNPFTTRSSSSVDAVVEVAETTENGEERVTTKTETKPKDETPMTLLNWPVVHERLPWSIVLLLGGGFALAKATQVSGLSSQIGELLRPLGTLPYGVLLLIVIFCTLMVTEITSNTATASIMLPILIDLCRGIELHPFALMLPHTISCSLAFNLPVATPPNSIVFSKGYLSVLDMIKSGCVLSILCGFIVIGCSVSYGAAMFNFHEYPDWAPAAVASFAGNAGNQGPKLMSVGNE